MEKINLEQFVHNCIEHSLDKPNARLADIFNLSLQDQGLEYKDGEILKTQRMVSAEAKEAGYGKPEQELTEFEKALWDWQLRVEDGEYYIPFTEELHEASKMLLKIARKQIASEINIKGE